MLWFWRALLKNPLALLTGVSNGWRSYGEKLFCEDTWLHTTHSHVNLQKIEKPHDEWKLLCCGKVHVLFFSAQRNALAVPFSTMPKVVGVDYTSHTDVAINI